MVFSHLREASLENGGKCPFFSINIPMFNCREFILDALESIQGQSFTDWEVVLFDDGSTDDTLDICEDQRTIPKDKLKIVKSSHVGQYGARRRLVEESSGEFIISLDADDMLIDQQALEKISNAIIETGCDVVLFNATRSLSVRNCVVDYSLLDIKEGARVSVANIISVMSSSYSLNNICFKAYRKTLWVEAEGGKEINNTEDRLQCAQIMRGATGCVVLDEPFYYYRPNQSSVTNSRIPFKYLQDLIYVEESLEPLFKDYHYDKEERERFLCQIVMGILGIMRSSCSTKQSRLSLYEKAARELSQSALFSRLSIPLFDLKSPCSSFAYNLLISDKIHLLDFLISIKDRFR